MERFKLFIRKNSFEIGNYLRKPIELPDSTDSLAIKWQYFLFTYILIVLMAILTGIFPALVVPDEKDNAIFKLIETYPLPLVILIGTVFIPLIEELIFRLGLSHKYNLLFQLILGMSRLLNTEKQHRIQQWLHKGWDRSYAGFFYFVAILFALLHLFNYELSWKIVLLSPLLVLPQFLGGLVIGYLRIRQGFVWGFLLHFLYNFTFLAIPLLVLNGPIEKLNKVTDLYSIQIEELQAGYSQSTFQLNDSNQIRYEGMRLYDVLSDLLQTDKKQIEFEVDGLKEIKLNLYFQMKDSIIDANSLIINELRNKYDFQIRQDSVDIEIVRVQVKDSSKLTPYLTCGDSVETSIFTTDSVVVKNGGISSVTYALNGFYDDFFQCDEADILAFSLTLQKVPREALKNYLEEQYGISLVLKKERIQKVYIYR